MENSYHFEIIEKAIKYIGKYHEGQPTLDEIASTCILASTIFKDFLKNGQV